MIDNDKKITTQEIKADSLPIIIVYKGQRETKEYVLNDNKDHSGLVLIKKEY
jgi:hypothetical protein